jgi:hypothetical protein
VGNLDLTAGTGSIFKDDADGFSISGANVALTAATNISNFGAITAATNLIASFSGTFDTGGVGAVGSGIFLTDTAGDLTVASASAPQLSFSAPTGNVILNPGAVLTGNVATSGAGNTSLTGGNAAMSGSLTTSMPVTVNGGVLSIGLATSLASLDLVNAAISGAGTLTTTGIFNSTDSSVAADFVNQGSMLLSGTNSFTGATFSQTGSIDIAAGATLQRPGGFNNAGIITGQGSIDVGAGNTLANIGGTLRPAGVGVAGTLSVTGNLDLSGGTLDIDMGGTGAGQSDKLDVTGDLIMGGALNAAMIGPYAPGSGDAIPFLGMGGSASGTFAPTTLPASFVAGYNLAGGEGARFIYSPAGLRTFTNGAGGMTWETAGNWSSGLLPGSADDVLISSGLAVVHGSGSDTVATMTINAANLLNVSGGSLTVLNGTTLDGTLAVSGTGAASLNGPLNGATSGQVDVSGGTLTLGGASSLSGYTQSGGVLNGGGNLTVSNGFNYSSGTVGLSGALDVTHVGNLSLPAMASLTSLLINATGDVTLAGGIAASGTGNAIVIAAGQDFINSGNHLLSASNGRWLVYSQSPATIVKGGLASDFRRYSNSVGSLSETGNGFVYASLAGALTVDTTVTGSTTHVYGDAPTASFGVTLTGFADAEDNPANIGLAGSPGYSMPLPTSTSDAGNYTIAYVGGLSSDVGYGFSSGTGIAYDVTRAPLAITASDQSKVYGDTLGFTGTEFSALGLKNGQTVASVTLVSGGANALAGVAGSPYAITASGAAGGSFNPANYNITYTDGALAVTPRPLTVSFTPPTKTYDGNVTASVGGYTLNNLANGDLPGVVATAAYDSRNVGATKTVNYSGLALTGGKTSDYSLPAVAIGSGSITPLASVAWTGGGSGNWSVASNWAGNALPDGSNVLAVSIPVGTTVTFDAVTAPTQLDSLAIGSGGGFVMAGSSLGIAGSLTTPAYSQSGGVLNGAGTLNVSENFTKSGGSLALSGPLNITQAAGGLTIINDAPLTLGAVSTISGNIQVDASGGIFTTASPVSANGGSLSFTAHSPIHVGSGGLSATADLSLSAPTPSTNSTITLDGPLTAGGAVNVSAYGKIDQNAGIHGQSIALSSTGGDIVLAAAALSSVPAGGSISYSAPVGSIASSPANFAGATPSLLSAAGTTGDPGTSSTVTNDIAKTIDKATDALGDEPAGAPVVAPPGTGEGTGGPVTLSSVSQTAGGDSGTFGASPEPEVGAGGTAVSPAPAGETRAPEGTPPNPEASSDAGKDKDEKKDETKDDKKKRKEDQKPERKDERRSAQKKAAQCT